MLYFNQSIYIHSHIETPHGVRRLGGGGIWQFRPETMELEVFIRGLVNPWGHHFDRWGQSFATDGAGGEGINYCHPGRLLLHGASTPSAILQGPQPRQPQVLRAGGRQRPAPARRLAGQPAHQRLPRQPRLPVRRQRRRRRVRLARAARADQDHARRLPADRRQDGARRRDLHRRLVQPDHPARRGRLPRPAPRPHPRPDLAGHGQGAAARAAAEAGRRDRPETCSMRSRPPRTGPGSRPSACSRSAARRRSSPALARLGRTGSTRRTPSPSTIASKPSGPIRRSTSSSPSCSRALLHSPDARVRAAAVRVVRTGSDRLPDPVALLAERVADEHPRVRLEAVRALAQFPSLRSAELAMSALDRPVDTFLEYALWLTATRARAAWLRRSRRAGSTSAAGRSGWSSPSRRSARPASSSRSWPCSRRGRSRRTRMRSVQTLIATLGEPADLAAVLDLVLTGRIAARAASRGAARHPGPGGRAAQGRPGGGPVPDRAAPGQRRRRHARRGAPRGRGLERRGAPGPARRAGGRADTSADGPRRGHRGARSRRARPRAVGRSRPSPSAVRPPEVQAMALAALRRGRPEGGRARASSAWLGRLSPDRAGDVRHRAGRASWSAAGARRCSPRRWRSGRRRCRPTSPSSASARSAPRAATSPP